MKNNYYVYVYIDPRNHEEFYFGKGKGSRKNRHLFEESDSKKAKRIAEIKKEGLSPIIRVIAAHLTEEQALLIEKTLLWKLGKWTTNISSGHYLDKFRPHNTLHKEISGFDYQNGLYYYNVGEGPHRNWNDYCKYDFISAGQGPRFRDAMIGFQIGDIFVAYLKKHGYVGIGRIKEKAKMIRDMRIKGVPLLNLPLHCKNMDDNSNNKDLSEYVCLVEWLKTVPRDEAKFSKTPKLYTTTHVRASLDNQPKTLKYLETEFKINLRDLVR
jgi:hypothetical protein